MKTLVRVTNWLGDAVLNTAALAALREADPGGRVAVLAIPWVADLFLHHPAVDEVMVYDRRGRHAGLRGLRSLARELRTRDFDRAFVFPNSFSSALAPFFARIPRRIGYGTDGRSILLTDVRRRDADFVRCHQVRSYLHLVGAEKPDRFRPRVYVSAEEREAAGRRLAAGGLDPVGLLAGLAPGAAYGPAKRWFPERFGETGRRLRERMGAGIVIFGSEADRAAGAETARVIPDGCLDLTGATGLRELAALLSRCAVLVTNDSGTMHLAAALGVPVVAVFGSTDPRATGPLGAPSRVIRHPIECSPCFERTCPLMHYGCMRLVEVDDVARAAEELARQGDHG